MAKKDPNEKGTPVLWRHHYAGMLLGWMSESDKPGHVYIDGVRIWSWSGGRTDSSNVASQGPMQGDKITAHRGRDVPLLGSVELYDVDEAHVLRGIEMAEE